MKKYIIFNRIAVSAKKSTLTSNRSTLTDARSVIVSEKQLGALAHIYHGLR